MQCYISCPGSLSGHVSAICDSPQHSLCSSRMARFFQWLPVLWERIVPQPFTWLTLLSLECLLFREAFPGHPHERCSLSLSLSLTSFISLRSPQQHPPFHYHLFAQRPFPPLECNPHVVGTLQVLLKAVSLASKTTLSEE